MGRVAELVFEGVVVALVASVVKPYTDKALAKLEEKIRDNKNAAGKQAA